MDVFKDNVGYGKELNNYFNGVVDYRKSHCYEMGGIIWAIHSYRKTDGEAHCLYQAEISVLRQSGHFTRGIFKAALGGYFNSHPGCERLTGLILTSNKKAIRLAKIAGFVEEGIIRRSDKKQEKLVFSILREEYEKKWKNKH